MRNIVLAIAAMALAPLALAAEGEGDDVAEKPTMAELKAKMDGISTEIAALAATVGNLATATVGTAATSLASKVDALATTVGTLSSTVTANHTTVVGKFAQQMAVVMTVPKPPGHIAGYYSSYYLVGDSSIPGFPSVTVGANGLFTVAGARLPVGTYLFELQHPYSDNVLCNGSVASRIRLGGNRFNGACPRVRLHLYSSSASAIERFDDGPVVYGFTAAGGGFNILHKFPTGFTFTDDKPLGSYSAAVRIARLN